MVGRFFTDWVIREAMHFGWEDMCFGWEEIKIEKLKPISPYRKKTKLIFFFLKDRILCWAESFNCEVKSWSTACLHSDPSFCFPSSAFQEPLSSRLFCSLANQGPGRKLEGEDRKSEHPPPSARAFPQVTGLLHVPVSPGQCSLWVTLHRVPGPRWPWLLGPGNTTSFVPPALGVVLSVAANLWFVLPSPHFQIFYNPCNSELNVFIWEIYSGFCFPDWLWLLQLDADMLFLVQATKGIKTSILKSKQTWNTH